MRQIIIKIAIEDRVGRLDDMTPHEIAAHVVGQKMALRRPKDDNYDLMAVHVVRASDGD